MPNSYNYLVVGLLGLIIIIIIIIIFIIIIIIIIIFIIIIFIFKKMYNASFPCNMIKSA